ncbi:uncharacterized protein MELLADRAFT_84962 [Melampsora larici-populina 98AG31]|uniref:GCM domain-containing protein n=1 Tax=Melampsora larici-populina (strain 98AG31 / pathotype 3-4-7) TaxID=747676 RepID=F4RHJ4_MELLP|nr:uncharacterized protein MELLADRAFT_84962 [Melampsora larici-populina 98AG31]EGG08184.1 hypothetical protein MELLADRAFT_84962 [Melampsora larici-populina 98AG31]
MMSEHPPSSNLEIPSTPDPSRTRTQPPVVHVVPTQATVTLPDPVLATSVSVSNVISPGEKKKKKRNRPKKTGKKFKTPVPAAGDLKTFIDHGTTCDSQGYPIYPNGNTVFVRGPRDEITNFGYIAYPHTQKSQGSKAESKWKTIWFKCLGVLHCDDKFCDYAAPPLTAEGKAAELILESPKATGWGVLRHSGIHNHVWPSSKKADPLAMRALTAQLVSNPKAGPLVLKVGQASAGQAVTAPVVEIHPAFGNGGRLGYLRRKVLVEKGLMPEKESLGGGDRLIMDLLHWGRNGLRLISTSLLGTDVHITFQSEWMAEQLFRRDKDNRMYSGGLLSDVTYRFFNHGYLLTTSMYSEIMHCWIPVQLTWMWGLEEGHYQAHFTTLLQQIYQSDITYHERDLLVQQVVDFSAAQKKGFISAYMNVFKETDPSKALSKLKGCHEHYRQSITRVKRNRNIVDSSKLELFERLALDLLEPDKPGGMTLRQKFDQIARLFPKAKAWIDWWNTSDIHSMLFVARERLPLDDPPIDGEEPLEASLPDTTNGQESMHRQYYILTSGHCTIVQGFVQLLLFTESLKRDFSQIRSGIAVKYGRNWDSIVETLGWSKERTRRKPDANDGRPPDTTDALIRPKKLGRPAGSTNVNRDRHSSYQSYSASNDRGKQNRCWETATLESIYPTFSPLWMEGSTGKVISRETLSVRPTCSWITSCSLSAMHQHRSDVISLINSSGTTNPPNTLLIKKAKFQPRSLLPSPQASSMKPAWNTPISLNFYLFGTPTQLSSGRPDSPDDRELSDMFPESSDVIPQLYERSVLDLTTNPMNLYFHLGNAAALAEDVRDSFMGEMQWPETLTFGQTVYQIVSRGFWGYNHYWCKVVRYVDGVMGVWYYDDRKDDGRGQLLGRELSFISGAQCSTSWLVYSRKPTSEEQKAIDRGVAKIHQKNPDSLGDIPFVSALDMAGVEEQIEEDLPSYEVTSTDKGPGHHLKQGHFDNKSKQAFTSTCPPVLGQHGGHDVKKQGRSGNQAKAAFSSTCPPALDHQHDDDHTYGDGDIFENKLDQIAQPVDAAYDSSSSEDMLDSVEVTHQPSEAKPDPLTLRLRIKRPAPDSSPVKSPSPSPLKQGARTTRKKSSGKKGAVKVEQLEPVLPPVDSQGASVDIKAKAKPKGRKEKVPKV